MKTNRYLITGMAFLLSVTAFSQLEKKSHTPVSVISQEDIFRAGVWNFNLHQNINIHPAVEKNNGDKSGNTLKFDTDIEANYFFIDHFGVGARFGLSEDRFKQADVDPEQVERVEVLRGGANLLYGTRVGGVLNILTKLSIGGGRERTIDLYGEEENKSDERFFTMRASVGTPLKLNRNVYFTPNLGFNYRGKGEGDYRKNYNTFFVGYNMDFFMGCGDDRCDLSDNPVPVSERYRQGEISVGSGFYGDVQLGTLRSNYEGDEMDKYGYGNTRLGVNGLYYVIDNLGVGAGISYSADRRKNKDSEYIESGSEFLFYPMARYHLPMDNMLRNFYGEAGFGIGYTRSKNGYGENIFSEKSFMTAWKAGIGYEYYIGENFSLSPMLGYGCRNNNFKDSDNKKKVGGIYAGVEWNFKVRR